MLSLDRCPDGPPAFDLGTVSVCIVPVVESSLGPFIDQLEARLLEQTSQAVSLFDVVLTKRQLNDDPGICRRS